MSVSVSVFSCAQHHAVSYIPLKCSFQHLWRIFVNNQLDPQFFVMYVYFYSLHVSDSHVFIISRVTYNGHQYIWFLSLCVDRTLWKPKVHYLIHKCRQLSLSWARSIQSLPLHPTSWWSILIFSSQLRLGLPRSLLTSGFPTKNLSTCYMPRPSILIDFITRTILGEQYRSLSSTVR